MKRTFKILSLIMVAVILLTASAISVSAGELPDGGQITNCGESYAYGYTSGVNGQSKVYVYCQVGMYQDNTGDGSAAAIYPEYSGSCTANQSLYMWEQTGNTYTILKSKDFNTSYISDNSYIVELYTNAYTVDKVTAGHQITIPGSGSFVAGTTVYPYD